MSVYLKRRQKLVELLNDNEWDGICLTQNVDLFYYGGSMQAGFLWISAAGEMCYFVRRSVARALEESDVQIQSLHSLRGFEEQLLRYFRSWVGKQDLNIGLVMEATPVSLWQRLQGALPICVWHDASKTVRLQRMIKGVEEIQAIERSAEVVGAAFDELLEQVRPGVRDLDLAVIVESALRSRGHFGLMRMRSYNHEIVTGMIGSGWAAALPTYFDGPAGGQGMGPANPQGAGNKVIAADEPILIDIGCCIDGYVIDQTRTVVCGDLPDDMAKAYDAAEAILKQTEMKLVPGADPAALYQKAVQEAERLGLAEQFMGSGDDRVAFLGHGIGLEIDEWPILADRFPYKLAPGMVIAIEPKFTFPERGVVGIEDTYVIEGGGYRRLTKPAQQLFRLSRG